ncbi:MAG: diadenylate cyclase CdaA [Desulfobulbaceae bacterium]|jgi:diadenylate cyclase|nr:diadenylate cyclase CdaA [Desulfobulbaceae bacterium]
MATFTELFRWQDILDIAIVAVIVHQIISIVRGTRSLQMLVGICVLIVVYFAARVFELATLMWLMQTFFSSLLLIVIIVFQQDIRRALTQVGRTPFHGGTGFVAKNIDEIVGAAKYLSKRKIGALMVMERDIALSEYVETGFVLDASLTKELLIAIFMPVSPLHDGGVIIDKGKIHSAACILPLTQNPYINKRYGTRHRAAIGISEETDAVVIVVSEETQEISLVRHGALTTMGDEMTLMNNLRAIFTSNQPSSLSWKNWFPIK